VHDRSKHAHLNNADPPAPLTADEFRTARSGGVVVPDTHDTSGPIKCAGAAQKTAHMAADWWRRHGMLDRTRLIMALPTSAPYDMHPLKRYTLPQSQGLLRGRE
jgi:hypothetical protein